MEGRSQNKNACCNMLLMHPGVAIVAHKIGRPELANNIAAFKNPEKSPKHKNKPKTNYSTFMCASSSYF